jgi:N-acetylglucosaminyldiphosphoundecaprenol N-acetyl-beta-D-mannosaminyltransferase
MKKLKIIKSLISLGSYQTQLDHILNLPKANNSSYVCIANVHMTIEVYQDKSFEQIVNNAELATPDGMPLAKAIKFIYGIAQERVAGMDLTADIMRECEKRGESIFVYGLSDETLAIFQEKAKEEFPNLSLNVYSPPFKDLSDLEKNEIVSKINNLSPDFVFVALGCPKQEKWMAEHKDVVNSCMIGLGGALEVYAGVKERAPQWMQEYSLEWLYRLIQDPKRLWKRYLVTNTLFIALFLKQLIMVKLFKKQ